MFLLFAFLLILSFIAQDMHKDKLDYLEKIKEMDKTVTRDAIRLTFDWIQKHSVIKDKNGDIIEDAVIDTGDKKIQDFFNEVFENEILDG